jgi:hypothetical protein
VIVGDRSTWLARRQSRPVTAKLAGCRLSIPTLIVNQWAA